jgi:hypothetical protein
MSDETTTYPNYSTYDQMGRRPSVLDQSYPVPTLQPGETYYPENPALMKYLSTEAEAQRFGAESFCEFLADTIEVEHCVVIPSVVSLRRIPYDIPARPKQDLYKTATDEGFHAEQSLFFLSTLRSGFGFCHTERSSAPLFLRRLEHQRALESDPIHRELTTVINGIVTETRISVELSKFARNETLAHPVREICRTHAEDEAVHSSQFRALGRWLWEEFDQDTRAIVSKIFAASVIARSLPDIDRFIDMLQRATNRPRKECERLVYEAYDEDMLIKEMLVAAHPTIGFLRNLGTEDYVSFDEALKAEKARLATELSNRRKALSR